MSGIFYSQNFKGEIGYSNTHESKVVQLSNDKLNVMLGTIQNYFTAKRETQKLYPGMIAAYRKMSIEIRSQ